ncbi:tyrosine-type recombinase/integrase [Halobacillus rhizosphaerae]|uniref:tyrosine-type recombinase/integrase n=1 Tax=Halobacillus rhizosphaerae TaxID=3064889 RepID=UPI00398B3F66
MAKLENIVHLNHKENHNPYATILTFLNRKGQNSKNTRDTYERHIKDFFITMRNKNLKELVEEDLIFTKRQIEDYQIALKDNYKGATVNNSISALKECYKKLNDDGFPVESTWFDLERYDEHDSRSYDPFTHEEVIKVIQLVTPTRKGAEKALLVRLAYATAFRQKSLLNLKWKDIVEKNGVWYIKTLGKRNKWSHKKLSMDLYNTLMEHKTKSKSEKIITLTKKTVQGMMDYIRSNMDFGDREIVFHSFKSASINEVEAITNGDVKAMQAHGDHSNFSTTFNNYVAKKQMEELVEVDINMKIPVEKFDELSQEELVSLIKSMDRNTQIKLLLKLGAM